MCTVVGDSMQRAPVFVFDNARDARDFVVWVDANIDKIREEAEATSSVAKLTYIDRYLSNKLVFLRFNYTTGDAAGQNMVGRATFAACSWILENHDRIRHFYLESNFATDKKSSQINVMRTRGKRVTAEATIPRDVLIQNMRVDPETLHYHAGIANVGAFISGANNNGCHSPNGITAMFIATGQDVANVAESSAGIVYTEVTPEKRPLHLDHHPVADRGHPRRRHRPRHPARVPGDPRLRRQGQGQEARRDHRRRRAGGRDLARPRRSRRSTGCRATSSTGGTGRRACPTPAQPPRPILSSGSGGDPGSPGLARAPSPGSRCCRTARRRGWSAASSPPSAT